jgi:hypothetical protein
MTKRRTHSPEFKARDAMEAISGRKTLQEIAADGAERLDPSEPVDGAAPGRRQRVSTKDMKPHAIEATVQRTRGVTGPMVNN